MRQRLLLPVQTVQILRGFEVCSRGFIIDRQRGIGVCEGEGELTQISQNLRARNQRVSILGVRR